MWRGRKKFAQPEKEVQGFANLTTATVGAESANLGAVTADFTVVRRTWAMFPLVTPPSSLAMDCVAVFGIAGGRSVVRSGDRFADQPASARCRLSNGGDADPCRAGCRVLGLVEAG
ncbi:MAG: hypothetical protein DWI21_13635 [Planctomycetota bacterium]|nr:MAG: hypothetical protein DWI21_13635 [Planctomycetota bacterium]